MSTLSQFAQTGKIKSIQRGTISLAANNISASAIITSVDTSKSILYHLGQDTSEFAGQQFNRSAYLTLANSTTVTASATRANSSSNTLTVSWQLVEYY